MSVVPFFVADRPMSLRILKGLPLQDHSDVRIGIMAHANTSPNFQQLFRTYPCEDTNFCDAAAGPCLHKGNVNSCQIRKHILDHTIKMCDSGIFTRTGATLTYEQLFETYDRMNVAYGIMIDVFINSEATLESAKVAKKKYEIFKKERLAIEPNKVLFELIAVAQGVTEEQYLQSYKDLKALGFNHIAIGGLLRKVDKTSRFARVRDEAFMYEILRKLREIYPDDWLFALGCFNPSRLEQFQTLDTWGDYKGWIFQYKKRNKTLNQHLDTFATLCSHLPQREKIDEIVRELEILIAERQLVVLHQETLSNQLIEGRRTLKESLRNLYEELQNEKSELTTYLDFWLTHSILDEVREKLVIEILHKLRKKEFESNNILRNIRKNRELKEQIEQEEIHLNMLNEQLIQQIIYCKDQDTHFIEDLEDLSDTIVGLVGDTERNHRFKQVRDKMEQVILGKL